MADRLPAPTRIDAVWLTRALASAVPGAQVTSVRSHGVSRGTTTRTRLEIAYDPLGTAAGLPTRVFAKGTPGLAQRVMLGAGGLAGGEARFYAEVRPRLEIEAPLGHFAAFHPRTWRSLVLLEDVVATRGARFWTSAIPMPREQIEDALRTVAGWHAVLWEDPWLAGLRWLRTPADHARLIARLLRYADRLPAGFARGGDVIPASVTRRRRELLDAMGRSMQRCSTGPRTYLHGDLHAANLYVTAAGRVGVADWQVGLRGGWAFDVAYLLSTTLAVEDRRAWERSLLDGYLDALAAAGARPIPSHETAWQAYRSATLYPLFAWLYTLGASRLQPAFQPQQVSRTLVGRIATAVEDLESFAAVGL